VQPADEEALEHAYRQQGPDLWRAIYAYSGGSRDVADECVAEAFAQAARAMHGIRDLRPWLFRAAFRIAAGVMSAERSRRTQPLDGIDPAASDGAGGWDAGLEELAARLTPTQRKAFVLREILGFSTTEAASLMGTSAVAVRVHVHGARTRLKPMYEEVER
jgi:RNA polymerase sigma-70 factor (ECF subfamily)